MLLALVFDRDSDPDLDLDLEKNISRSAIENHSPRVTVPLTMPLFSALLFPHQLPA